jgi:hypothetical protein
MTLLELWASKEEYKKHDKDIFQGHIFQERSKQKFEGSNQRMMAD